VTNLAAALAADPHRRFDVSVLFVSAPPSLFQFPSMPHWAACYAQLGVRLLHLPRELLQADDHLRAAYVRDYIAEYAATQGSFDVIHFPEWRGIGAVVALDAALGIAPFDRTGVVVTTHGGEWWNTSHNGHDRSWNLSLLESYERLSVEHASVLISPSAYMPRWYAEARDWDIDPRAPAFDPTLQFMALTRATATITEALPLSGSSVAVDPSLDPFPPDEGGLDSVLSAISAGTIPGFRRRPVLVVPNILFPLLPPSASDTYDGTAVSEIVFFGRLERRKGLFTFCDAIDSLAPLLHELGASVSFLGTSVTLNGGQTSAEYVEERRQHWQLPGRLLSDLDSHHALEYLANPTASGGLRLAVMASSVDNSPYTVLECILRSIPFVTADTGGTPELMARSSAEYALFPPEGAAPDIALAETIFKVLNSREVRLPSPAVPQTTALAALTDLHLSVGSLARAGLLRRPLDASLSASDISPTGASPHTGPTSLPFDGYSYSVAITAESFFVEPVPPLITPPTGQGRRAPRPELAELVYPTPLPAAAIASGQTLLSLARQDLPPTKVSLLGAGTVTIDLSPCDFADAGSDPDVAAAVRTIQHLPRRLRPALSAAVAMTAEAQTLTRRVLLRDTTGVRRVLHFSPAFVANAAAGASSYPAIAKAVFDDLGPAGLQLLASRFQEIPSASVGPMPPTLAEGLAPFPVVLNPMLGADGATATTAAFTVELNRLFASASADLADAIDSTPPHPSSVHAARNFMLLTAGAQLTTPSAARLVSAARTLSALPAATAATAIGSPDGVRRRVAAHTEMALSVRAFETAEGPHSTDVATSFFAGPAAYGVQQYFPGTPDVDLLPLLGPLDLLVLDPLADYLTQHCAPADSGCGPWLPQALTPASRQYTRLFQLNHARSPALTLVPHGLVHHPLTSECPQLLARLGFNDYPPKKSLSAMIKSRLASYVPWATSDFPGKHIAHPEPPAITFSSWALPAAAAVEEAKALIDWSWGY
jgi:glycosyltransferase involved in cell wall biosynthesis